jgi:hypothetical protein
MAAPHDTSLGCCDHGLGTALACFPLYHMLGTTEHGRRENNLRFSTDRLHVRFRVSRQIPGSI